MQASPALANVEWTQVKQEVYNTKSFSDVEYGVYIVTPVKLFSSDGKEKLIVSMKNIANDDKAFDAFVPNGYKNNLETIC